MADLKTRAGISPSQRELPYEITTTMVEDYLQKKLDVVMSKAAGRENNEKGDYIRLRVYTTEASRDFLPFMVILPMEAMKDTGAQTNEIPDIFNMNSNSGTVCLRPEIFRFFSPYVYSKEDEKAFFSDEWRHRTHVARGVPALLKKMRSPRIMKLDGGREEFIGFMIDPIRVFFDMLFSVDGSSTKQKPEFYIEISSWKKIRTGEYNYLVKRIAKNNRKRERYDGDDIANELNRCMRGVSRSNNRRY